MSRPAVLAVALALTALAPRGAAQQRWYETARLIPPPGLGPQHFGAAVDLDGDRLLVGAPRAEGPLSGSLGAGQARVYLRDGLTWQEEALLETPAPPLSAAFGNAVALDGDTAAVGLPGLDLPGGLDQGGVGLFSRASGAWVLEATLTVQPVTADPARLGASLALDGDTLAVGAPDASVAGQAGAGAVHLFTRQAGRWSPLTVLVSPEPTAGAAFGDDLALEGDQLLVGEPGATPQAAHLASGAARAFRRVGGAWQPDGTLVSLDVAAFDGAGVVALSGDRAALGAPGLLGPGEITTFVRQGGQWVADELLFDLVWTGKARDLALDGDTLLTGTLAFVPDGQRPGALVYDLAAGAALGPVAWARDGDSGQGETLAAAVLTLRDDTLVLANPLHDGGGLDAGAVHVFTRDGPWTDRGQALQGGQFVPPLLYGAGPVASPSSGALLVGGLPQGGLAWLVVGGSELSVPFKGGLLVPAPDLALGPLTLPAGQGDAASLAYDLPPGLPPGTAFQLQAWLPDPGGPQGYAASNALEARVP